MCGIFALLNSKYLDKKMLEKEFQKGKSRGPEYSKFMDLSSINSYLDFIVLLLMVLMMNHLINHFL